MGRIEAGMVVGGVQIGVEILGGRVALSVSGELLEAGADVAVVIERVERLTVVEDAGEVTRLRHLRREGRATLPAGDVTLDSGPAEAVELAESGEYLLADDDAVIRPLARATVVEAGSGGGELAA